MDASCLFVSGVLTSNITCSDLIFLLELEDKNQLGQTSLLGSRLNISCSARHRRRPAHNLRSPGRSRQPPVCLLLSRVTFVFVFAAHMCKNSVEALIIQIFLFAPSWALLHTDATVQGATPHCKKSRSARSAANIKS